MAYALELQLDAATDAAVRKVWTPLEASSLMTAAAETAAAASASGMGMGMGWRVGGGTTARRGEVRDR